MTGARGQDGTLLRRALQSRGVDVLGIDRHATDGSDANGEVVSVDVTDSTAVVDLLRQFAPHHVYHLAACHHSSEHTSDVGIDREMIATNFRATETLATTIVEALPLCRLLIAGSSQMYSSGLEKLVVTEKTPMNPSTFYGRTKAWARELVYYYRMHRGLHGVTAILFNHESSLRPANFATRKITMAAARARKFGEGELHLRDVTAAADWSSAEDAVNGMLTAMHASVPDDYVIASGISRTIEDVLVAAFGGLGLDWRDFTTFDLPSNLYRGQIVGDASRLRAAGWAPQLEFNEMIEQMTIFDLDLLDHTA